MGVGLPDFKNVFKESRGEYSYLNQLSPEEFDKSYKAFGAKLAADANLSNMEQYFDEAEAEAKITVDRHNTGSGWDVNSWNNYVNSANNTGDGGQFTPTSGWTQTDWDAYVGARGDNYVQDDYSQGYQNVLDAAGQNLVDAWLTYNQGAGGTDLTALEEAAANAASAEGSAFQAITNQGGFNTATDLTNQINTAYDTLAESAETQLGGLTTQDLTNQINTAYDTLVESAETQLGGLETKDFTPEIRGLIESGRLDLRNLNAEQLGVLNDAFTRRTGQIGDIQGQLEGQLQQQEGFRRSIQEQIADTTATRAGQMTADMQARVEEARGALGGQVTSSFEDAAMLAGGLTGSQAMSSTAGMDRLAQVANQGAAQRLAAPAMLAAEAKLAVGDEKFRLENQLSLALTEGLAELGAQERAQVLQEAMRQEEFGAARDQALANALVNIAQNRTGAQLTEQGRLEQFDTDRDRALANTLTAIAQNRTGAQLNEQGRLEQFDTDRDRALAEAQLAISGQETAAELSEAQRMEDILQRQGEITQAQGFATAQQEETQRFQQEQQRLAMEFQNANNEIDRQMARDQMAQNERQFNLKIAQQEADRAIDTAAYEADLNLRTDEAKEAAYQANQAYELELAAQGASQAAEIAAAEAAQATLAQNRSTTHGLAVSVLGLDISYEDFMVMDQKQVDDINKRIVDEMVRSNKANKHVVGSKGWFEGQGFNPLVASDAVAFTAWSDRIAVLEAKPGYGAEVQEWTSKDKKNTESDISWGPTLTSAEAAELADLKKKRNDFMDRNTFTDRVDGDPQPNDHLLAVQTAYTLMGTARDEEVGWQGGRSAEDVLGGDMTAASWEATYTNIWNDAFAGAGGAINQQEWVEPPVVPARRTSPGR